MHSDTLDLNSTEGESGSNAAPPLGEKWFTQADLDRHIQERLGRAKESAQRKLLESLGVKDVEEIKRALSRLKHLQRSQWSERQKLEQERAAARQVADDARRQAEERIQRANEKLIRGEVVSAAIERFVDPQGVWLLISNDPALRAQLKLKEDDSVEGVQAVLDQVAEQKKHWLKTRGASPLIQTPTVAGSSRSNDRRELELGLQVRPTRMFVSGRVYIDLKITNLKGGNPVIYGFIKNARGDTAAGIEGPVPDSLSEHPVRLQGLAPVFPEGDA